MKKILTSLILALALPVSAFASTLSLTPSTISVAPGQTFSVTIAVNPQEADYTVEAFLSYSAPLLEVVSFTQAPGWLTLSQAGYDSVDNTSGRLVKTAGYSGGVSSSKVFGTVTFKATSAGTAMISAADGSQILDANNHNTFTSGSKVTVSIAAPVAAPLPVAPLQKSAPAKSASNPARTPLSEKPIATSTEPEPATSTAAVATTSESVENVAAVAGARSQEVSLALGALSTLLAFDCGLFLGRRQKRSY